MAFSGVRLRQIRHQRGLSQRDMPVAHDTVSAIESGRRKPHPSTLRKLAAALNCEVGDFFEEATLAVPLGENAAEEPGRQRDLPPLEDPRIVAVLREWGYVPDAEYVAGLQSFDPEIDEEGTPRGVERAIDDLKRDRDRLLGELLKPTNYKRLFPERSSFSKADELGSEHIQVLRASYASKLRREVQRDYNRRILALTNFSAELYAAGQAKDFLLPSQRAAVVEGARQRMLEDAFKGQKAG